MTRKKFFPIITSVLILIIFYSCKNDTPVTNPVVEETPKFTRVDSIPNMEITHISMGDENNVYFVGFQFAVPKAFKITNGVREQIVLQDVNFTPLNVSAYSSTSYTGSYYAYAGPIIEQTIMKTYNNGVIKTAILDSHTSRFISAMKVITPGKIVVATDSTMYLYDNGNVSQHRLTSGFSVREIAYSDNKIYFSSSGNSGNTQRVDKLENGILTNIEVVTLPPNTSSIKSEVGGYLVNQTVTSKTTLYSYLNGTEWVSLFSLPNSCFARGESLNKIYLIGRDLIWTGASLQSDPVALRIGSGVPLSMKVSNLRSDTYFIAVNYVGETHIYRRK